MLLCRAGAASGALFFLFATTAAVHADAPQAAPHVHTESPSDQPDVHAEGPPVPSDDHSGGPPVASDDHAGGHRHGVTRPDSHAPIGVMGEHAHGKGDVMLSYRFSRMHMRDNRDGTQRVSSREVLRAFPVTPTSMDMEMHMLGAMWAPVDSLTLMAMVPFIRMEMDHRTRTGRRFTTRTQGLGDVKLSGLFRLWTKAEHQLLLNAGLSLPTGSISEKDDTPMGRVRLPYPMQLGSGTWDILPGLTYTGLEGDTSFGAQVTGSLRTGRNNKGYRLGHAYKATGWVARQLLPWLSASLRLEWNDWNDIEGSDDDLMRRLVPTADPDLRGGQRLDLLIGVNLIGIRGVVRGHRLAIELGTPIHQDLDGPQLEVDWRGTVGWQYAF